MARREQRKHAAHRRRRFGELGGVVFAAAAIVAVLVAVSAGGGAETRSVPAGGQAANPGGATGLLVGLPQQGLTLGSAKAPVTLVEFGDMQCPTCADYQRIVFPSLVKAYVRTGKLRMEMRLQSFLGPDSETAAKAVAAAAEQNRAWTFADVFYRNQGQENSGYVTPDFVRSIAAETPGLNHTRLARDAAMPAASDALKQGSNAFSAAGFTGTPSFLVGRTGGPLQPLNWSSLTPGQFTSRINQLLA